MTPDEQIRDAFHARFGTALSDLTVDPALLVDVRRRHARQQRVMMIGAPIGVAALAAGSIVAATAVGSDTSGGSSILPGGTHSSGAGASVTLLHHTLAFPSGWSGEAGSIQHPGRLTPHGPLAGEDQSAKLADSDLSISLTMYRGPIAAAEKQVIPAVTPRVIATTIAGLPATVDESGTYVACSYIARSVKGTPQAIKELLSRGYDQKKAGHGARLTTGGLTTTQGRALKQALRLGECARQQTPQTVALADHVTTGITFADGDFLLVDSIGMSPQQIEHVLADAINS